MLRWFLIAVLAAGITMAAIIAPQMLSSSNRATDDLKFPTSAAENVGPLPVASVDHEPTHAFEPMPQNAEGTHVWKITNTGKTDLELTKGPSTCSCTIANFKNDESKFVLKPGDSTEIELKWETRTNNGEFKKSASVLTNDPYKPSIEFVVQGIVRPAVSVVPPEQVVNFNNVSNDQPNSYNIALYSSDHADLKVTKVSTSKPGYIETSVQPLSEEERMRIQETRNRLNQKEPIFGQKVVVTLKPGMPVGLFSEEVSITTDHPNPKQGPIKVLLSGKMIGPIGCYPEVIRMSQVQADKGATMQAALVVRDKKPVKFEIVSKPEGVNVKVTAADAAKAGDAVGRYRLSVEIPVGAKPGSIEGPIVLKTDHPNVGEMSIPVQAIVLGTK